MATPFARVVYHYPAFIDAIRDRTADLGISRLEIDRIGEESLHCGGAGGEGLCIDRHLTQRFLKGAVGQTHQRLGVSDVWEMTDPDFRFA